MTAFNRIALGLSGGGYRAAAFHLGVLHALHELDLLASVKIVSTASGGTLLACRWLRALVDNASFADFFARSSAFLKTKNAILLALDRMATQQSKPSLICAAADVYDAELTNGLKLGDVGALSVEEIVLNTTEFRAGLDFRFQRSRNDNAAPSGYPGMWLNARRANAVRLADIAAASSCFPGAFEPMAFPRDFTFERGFLWRDGSKDDELDVLDDAPLALMDGGIFDNQGVDGMRIADERTGKAVDLFIISDTDAREDDFLDAAPTPKWSFLRAWHVLFVALALSAAVFASSAMRAYTDFADDWTLMPVDGFLAVFALLVGFACAWLRWGIERRVSKFIGANDGRAWDQLWSLPVTVLVDAVVARARSLVALTSGVFMKRVRRLTQQVFFPTHYDRTLSCFTYTYAGDVAPTPAIRALAIQAREVPTRLWLDDDGSLDALIACGRFTVVGQLLAHLEKRRATGTLNAEQAQLADATSALWTRIQADPLVR